MIKAVLFDIDNTLLDFDAYVQEAMKNGFQEFSLGRYEDWMLREFTRINNQMWRQIELGALTREELLRQRWDHVFAALNISFDGNRFEAYFQHYLFDNAIPVEGAMDILHYLKDRYILCTASNGPYEQQLNRLKVGKMLPLFSKCFISEQVGASKPSEQFFSHCLQELNAEQERRGEEAILPAEIMMIGDSLTSDIAGGINSGFQTCFFDKNKTGRTNGLPVDHVIDRLEDIRSFL